MIATLRGSSLAAVDREQVRALLQQTGAIWFRDFATDVRGFLSFIEPFACELITLNNYDRAPHPEAPQVQTVTGGTQALSLHAEMGHVPGRPDFLAFWCERPGSPTLLADGIALWAALSEATKTLFLSKRLRSVMRVPKAWWSDRIGSGRFADAQAAFDGVRDVTLSLQSDESLVIDWRSHGAFRPNFGDALCFASNVFAGVIPGLSVSFEDGTPIPGGVIDELEAVADRLTTEVTWSAGEVVLIDNTRWLHGRRAVTHVQQRKLHMLQGYLACAPPGRLRIGRS